MPNNIFSLNVNTCMNTQIIWVVIVLYHCYQIKQKRIKISDLFNRHMNIKDRSNTIVFFR